MNQRTAVLLSLMPLAACTGKGVVSQTADGKIRVVHVAEGQWKKERARTEMESALDRLDKIDLVYAHNDPMALGARDACLNRGRKNVRFVGCDALADEGRRAVADGSLDASIEYPTCGAEAVDLALLAIESVALPKKIKFGTRVWTKATLAAGGEVKAKGGEIVLDTLRREHATKFAKPATVQTRWKIGMSQCTVGEPWRVAMNTDITRRVAEYPQLELVLLTADDDTEKQRTHLRQFVEMGCKAILVSPKESMALVAPCKEAMAKGIPVIVLDRELGSDDYTCFIGGDNERIGRAAGDVIRTLLGGAGDIVEIEGLMTSSPAQERHQGFVAELGLQPAK
jgi:ABC-type sugar transport system substrate-binding protein